MTALTPAIAEKFADAALAHVSREYPNFMQHGMAGPEDIIGPRAAHPIFFGSYDWHSCVHGFWLLARLMRRQPDLSRAGAIEDLLAQRINAANVDAEIAYLARPTARGFERPYGWAWLLALQAELNQHGEGSGRRAAAALQPLTDAFAARFRSFLPLADYPVRTGVHSSTAFALRLSADYAQPHDPALYQQMRAKALSWYGDDASAQTWEPSQDDFLSPSLIEAECMRRFMAPEAFAVWFKQFLPEAANAKPAALFAPARVSDRSDGKIAHLDGLNLSRAWCWRSIARGLGDDDPVAPVAFDAAERHIAAALAHVTGDYMGEHWLATFALLALEA